MEVKKYVDALIQHATDHHRPHELHSLTLWIILSSFPELKNS